MYCVGPIQNFARQVACTEEDTFVYGNVWKKQEGMMCWSTVCTPCRGGQCATDGATTFLEVTPLVPKLSLLLFTTTHTISYTAQWSLFLSWIEESWRVMIKIYVKGAWMWFHVSSFAWIVKSVNDFFCDFKWINSKFLRDYTRKIAKITGIGHEWDFTIWNQSETKLREMLKIAFKREFSVNLNSLTHL